MRKRAVLLLTVMAATLVMVASPAWADATFIVNSTGDDGDIDLGDGECATKPFIVGTEPNCTLRAALQEANATTAADTINFNIGGSGVKTISPVSALPSITEPVTIDGYSEPGASPNTLAVGSDAVLKIELSGASSFSGIGLHISGPNSTVKGLVTNRWSSGVFISGSGATGNEVIGNFLGTDASGTQDPGNENGVFISGAPNNTVGGTTAATRNIISGNSLGGVVIVGANATGNKVMGNYVGTDKNGTADLGNSNSSLGNHFGGVLISGASNNTVGGTTTGARNVISGNNQDGVRIENSTDNEVLGNFIGTGASGTQDLGNSGSGVSIHYASENIIEGTMAVARNIISGNSSDGVAISGNVRGINLVSNSIFSNGALGIDLLNDNVPNLNDPDDTDGGSNKMQNYPTLSSAVVSGTNTIIRGSLNSEANRNYTVQFFSSPQADPSGYGEGKTFLGQKTDLTTGPSGNASFSFTTSAIPAGQMVSATASDLSGNTSEFSRAVAVVNTAPTITKVMPVSGSKTRDTTPLIAATVRDAQTNLAKSNIKLFVDNQAKPFSYNTSTDRLSYVSRRLSFASHTARLVATDGVLRTTKRWSFKVIGPQ